MIKNEEDVKRLLTDSKSYIIATDKGIGVFGSSASILTCLIMLVKHCLENNIFSEKVLDESLKLAKMNNKELAKEALKYIKDEINKMED